MEIKNLFKAHPSLCDINRSLLLLKSWLHKITETNRGIVNKEQADCSDAQGVLKKGKENQSTIPVRKHHY
jgi:hypothetical protein